MASFNLVKDIKDVFINCTSCSCHFKDPKLLPCLHRFCRECLVGVISDHEGTFECPMCQHVCIIPDNGVDGFKTDHHMVDLVRFMELQKSFENEETRECVGCSKRLKVAAYCFKCKPVGFLCNDCYNVHMESEMLKSHQANLIIAKDGDPANLTLEKVTSFTEPYMCPIHNGNKAELCCNTCANSLACVACKFSYEGEHKDHIFEYVRTVAHVEKERVYHKLIVLRKEMDRIHDFKETMEHIKQKLLASVAERKMKLRMMYDSQALELNTYLKQNEEELERCMNKVNAGEKSVIDELKANMEEEHKQIAARYTTLIDTVLIESATERNNLKQIHSSRTLDIRANIEALDHSFYDLNEITGTKEQQNLHEIGSICEETDKKLNRFENLETSAATVIASKSNWKDVVCLPDISNASSLQSVSGEFPWVESLSHIIVDDLSLMCIDYGTITEDAESTVEIKELVSRGWEINNMTGAVDARIVTSGLATDDQSHITVINMNGEILRQNKLKRLSRGDNPPMPYRYCAYLNKTKVVTVSQCSSNHLGIYDARSGDYSKRDISDFTHSWLDVNRRASCIAVDPANLNIFEGSFDNKNIYVFSGDKHAYLQTVQLPKEITWPRAIAIKEGHILVCDSDGEEAYVVRVQKPEPRIVHAFTKPHFGRGECTPIDVCTDKSGYIYILWDATIGSHVHTILTQYSQSGRQLLTKKVVDLNARSITTLDTADGEKMLVVTIRSAKLYIYGLVQNEDGTFDSLVSL